MFPKTELSEIAERIPLVVFSNTCYYVSHGNINGNFLLFFGRKFPLQKYLNLEEIEEKYFKKAEKEIEDFKRKIAKQSKYKQKELKKLREEITKNEFLRFYLFVVQNYYVSDLKRMGSYGQIGEKIISIDKINQRETQIPITMEIFSAYGGNIAILNRRIFPLEQISEKLSPLVIINNNTYGFVESQITLEEFEEIVQERLKSKLEQEVLDEIPYIQNLKKEISRLEGKLEEKLGTIVKCKKNKYSYEYGNLGFDMHNKYVYWLSSKPGINLTRAIGTPLIKVDEKIRFQNRAARKWLTRSSPNTPFSVGNETCIRTSIEIPTSNNIKDILNYLKECSTTL